MVISYYCLLLRKMLFLSSVVWGVIVPESMARELCLTRQYHWKTVPQGEDNNMLIP